MPVFVYTYVTFYQSHCLRSLDYRDDKLGTLSGGLRMDHAMEVRYRIRINCKISLLFSFLLTGQKFGGCSEGLRVLTTDLGKKVWVSCDTFFKSNELQINKEQFYFVLLQRKSERAEISLVRRAKKNTLSTQNASVKNSELVWPLQYFWNSL